MRRRLIVSLLLSIAVIGTLATGAAAQEAGGGGGGDSDGGSDQSAGGDILGDGADVFAGDGSDLGDPTNPRPGGGNVVCRYYNDLVGQVDLSQPEPPVLAEMQANGEAVLYVRICEDSVTGDLISWTEDIALDLPAIDPIDPQQLALMARNRLPFVLPDVAFSPPLESPDDFLLVQLPTWIWVENWGEESRSATAGGVVATVTARPVRQEWDFTPNRLDPETEGGCAGPGRAYDASIPPESQSTECSFTFRHSSAGEQGAAYEGHLTVFYEITWTSNIGVGGSLGTVPRTTVMPVRVGEQQALNEAGGTEQ
jgi:hypothetical protein